MRPAWIRKDGGQPSEGPLKGVARERLRAVPTTDLVTWIDNSLSKIGKLVHDSQRVHTDDVLLRQAETEAAALVQALRELAGRCNAA